MKESVLTLLRARVRSQLMFAIVGYQYPYDLGKRGVPLLEASEPLSCPFRQRQAGLVTTGLRMMERVFFFSVSMLRIRAIHLFRLALPRHGEVLRGCIEFLFLRGLAKPRAYFLRWKTLAEGERGHARSVAGSLKACRRWPGACVVMGGYVRRVTPCNDDMEADLGRS